LCLSACGIKSKRTILSLDLGRICPPRDLIPWLTFMCLSCRSAPIIVQSGSVVICRLLSLCHRPRAFHLRNWYRFALTRGAFPICGGLVCYIDIARSTVPPSYLWRRKIPEYLYPGCRQKIISAPWGTLALSLERRTTSMRRKPKKTLYHSARLGLQQSALVGT
jgi:hypothetical protein